MLSSVSTGAYFGEAAASMARTQDEGALGECVEDEDEASGVAGR